MTYTAIHCFVTSNKCVQCYMCCISHVAYHVHSVFVASTVYGDPYLHSTAGSCPALGSRHGVQHSCCVHNNNSCKSPTNPEMEAIPAFCLEGVQAWSSAHWLKSHTKRQSHGDNCTESLPNSENGPYLHSVSEGSRYGVQHICCAHE